MIGTFTVASSTASICTGLMRLLSHLLRWCKAGTQEYVSIGRRLGKKLGSQICFSKLKKTCKSYYDLYNPFTRLSCSKYS